MRAKEICQLRAVLQPDHMTLRGIEKRSRPQVNEPRPALTMAVAEWNAGYRETLVGKRPEIRRKQSHRVCHLPAHCLRHGGGCERADRALNRTLRHGEDNGRGDGKHGETVFVLFRAVSLQESLRSQHSTQLQPWSGLARAHLLVVGIVSRCHAASYDRVEGRPGADRFLSRA